MLEGGAQGAAGITIPGGVQERTQCVVALSAVV